MLRACFVAWPVLLDCDLFATASLDTVQVRLTMVGGRIVHRRQ